MHWPPILSLCGIPMGVLSNTSSARLRPYLILFVLRGIIRHVVLSRSWHRMGEMQIKLSLQLINTRDHLGNIMLERISSCSSSASGSSSHIIRCLDVRERKKNKKKQSLKCYQICSCTSSPLPPQPHPEGQNPQLSIQGTILFAFQGQELFQ